MLPQQIVRESLCKSATFADTCAVDTTKVSVSIHHGKNYVIYNCEPIRRAIRKEDNKYGGRSVETRVHAYEKQFRLGLQKGMEDFPLFLRAGLMMFQ